VRWSGGVPSSSLASTLIRLDPRPRAAALDAIIVAMRGPHGLSADVERLGHPPVSTGPVQKKGNPLDGCACMVAIG
jgi:hypothetical protein